MSEESVLTDGVNLKAYQDEVTRLHGVIAERDREIERLRGWLAFLAEDAGDVVDHTHATDLGRQIHPLVIREFVEQALAGEAAPQ